MVFYAVFFAIAAACAAALAAIVVRKFPQLTLIDTASLPKERDAEKKKEIIKGRVSRMTANWWKDIVERFAPFGDKMRGGFRRHYAKILALERKFQRKPQLSPEEREKKIAELAAAAALMRDSGNAGEAEKKYIELISIDPKNTAAYRGLGALYMNERHHDQARETFAFLVKMGAKQGCLHVRFGQAVKLGGSFAEAAVRAEDCPASAALHAELAKNYMDLGLALRALGGAEEAKDAFERTALIEPSNPKYLDLLLETCILGGDKVRAREVFERLKEVNPENQKLDSFAAQIAALPDPEPAADKRKKKKKATAA